jgi:hypothetical protein
MPREGREVPEDSTLELARFLPKSFESLDMSLEFGHLAPELQDVLLMLGGRAALGVQTLVLSTKHRQLLFEHAMLGFDLRLCPGFIRRL